MIKKILVSAISLAACSAFAGGVANFHIHNGLGSTICVSDGGNRDMNKTVPQSCISPGQDGSFSIEAGDTYPSAPYDYVDILDTANNKWTPIRFIRANDDASSSQYDMPGWGNIFLQGEWSESINYEDTSGGLVVSAQREYSRPYNVEHPADVNINVNNSNGWSRQSVSATIPGPRAPIGK